MRSRAPVVVTWAEWRAWERQAGVRRPWAADLAAGVGLLALFALLVWLWAATPVVSQVWPTGECVRVDPPHTCAALPARYAVQWVAPPWWRAQ